MKHIHYENITLDEMLTEMVDCIREGIGFDKYYWHHEDKGFLEITECDLFYGRIIMEDGDFSEFDWEIEESSIYKQYIKVV
jgi:hypothetical protein